MPQDCRLAAAHIIFCLRPGILSVRKGTGIRKINIKSKCSQWLFFVYSFSVFQREPILLPCRRHRHPGQPMTRRPSAVPATSIRGGGRNECSASTSCSGSMYTLIQLGEGSIETQGEDKISRNELPYKQGCR